MKEELAKLQAMKRKGVKSINMTIDEVIRLVMLIDAQCETLDYTNAQLRIANGRLADILDTYNYAKGM